MTGNNDKLRSLFLTALMVFSVFAGTVALSGSAAAAANGVSIDEAVEYTANDGTDGQIEVIFNSSVNAANLNEVLIDGSPVSGGASIEGGTATDGDREVEINLNNNVDVTPNQNLTVEFTSVDDAPSGDTTNDVDITDAEVTSTTLAENGGNGAGNAKIVRVGEPVAFISGGSGEEVSFGDITGGTGTDSQIYTYDSDNLDSGTNYSVSFPDGDTQYMETKALGLSVSTSNNITNDDALEVDVEINRGGAAVARLYESDGDHVDTIGDVDTNGGKTTTFNFSTQETGDYYVNVTDNATGTLVQTDTINVEEAASGDAGFVNGSDVITDEVGDVASIPITLDNTDEATVIIGSNGDGYHAAAEVTDGDGNGEVTVEFNSYTAGSNQDPISVADDDDDVDAQSEGGDFTANNGGPPDNALLDNGQYQINVTVGHQGTGTPYNNNADVVGTLSLRDRSTNAANIWIAPEEDDFRSWDGDTITHSAGANITQSSEVANGDYAIVQVNATGLEGAFSYWNRNNNNMTQSIMDEGESTTLLDGANSQPANANFQHFADGNLDLHLNQTNPGQNRDAKRLLANESNTHVIADSANDSYYFAIDTGAINHSGARYLQNGDKFKANFSVEANSTLETSGDNEVQSVNDTFKVVEPDVTLRTNSDGDVEIESATNQTIHGSSNLAPGTNVTVRVDSNAENNPFLTRPEGVVQPNGDFTTNEKDYTDLSPGTNLTLSVDQNGVDETWDGIVVEETADTETEAPDTETEAPDTETEAPDTETEMPDTETEMPDTATEEETTTSTGPGFTIIAALGALIAAALLAVRRNN